MSLKIGKNAQDNWNIIDNALGDYYWFHLANLPSCHVILEEINPNKDELIVAAQQCKIYSKYKNHNRISVIYTQVKNISKGVTIGSVYTKKIKRVVV